MDKALGKGYVNSKVPNRSGSSPARPTIGTGQSISPSFIGEYVMTQVGVIAIGNPSTVGFDLACLHFGYGMSSGPEVSVTDQFRASKTLGRPFLAVQTAHLVASLIAVVKAASGPYAVINVGFGSCPMGSMRRDATNTTHRNSMLIEDLPALTYKQTKESQNVRNFPKS